MKHTFTYQGQPYELDLTPSGAGYRVTYQGQTYEMTRQDTAPGKITLLLNGRPVTLHIAADRDFRWVAVAGRTYQLKRETRSRRAHAGDTPQGLLHAPMPGQVRAVNVQIGDPVTKGQTLLLLEAMKMEIRIQAPADGTVAKITVKVGDQVEKEQTLIEIT
ncbi:MAG TPA: biotin/lipoyl-binding protein [Anaerolineales bacterium]|nr:biotin/lipoyl-binding protein [Anaerolineales bacterium]